MWKDPSANDIITFTKVERCQGERAEPCAAANGGGPSRLPSTRLVAVVAELGALSHITRMAHSLPISPSYRKPIFEAVGLQVLLGFLSLLILDGGTTARICGIALVAFWGGATVLILRRPQLPSRRDIELLRFGYLPLVVIAFFLVHFIWTLRGVE